MPRFRKIASRAPGEAAHGLPGTDVPKQVSYIGNGKRRAAAHLHRLPT
ncbi:MAG TPA: hypothetical protein VHE55_18685 [Fimbriimonadaceae bacterium]|nr:hypothetical protein [Fimbriimonadaceae bacterium]